MRRCLADEKKATKLDEALAASREATGIANQRAGEISRLEKDVDKERATSDERLVKIVQLRQDVERLERRPRVWVVVVAVVGAVLVGGAGGYAVGQVASN